mmetsp:Transcript_28049/g.89488  ORF Transcript_28049/g.89488 Transcript_28049/m.89488 type:complete len:86 (-) Transcript_28049:995-1252(-)
MWGVSIAQPAAPACAARLRSCRPRAAPLALALSAFVVHASSSAMPGKVTVASTRVANYALGSKLLAPGSPGQQMVLHADWVTCTQ